MEHIDWPCHTLAFERNVSVAYEIKFINYNFHAHKMPLKIQNCSYSVEPTSSVLPVFGCFNTILEHENKCML